MDINPKFFELSEECRNRIIHAGFEVFGKNEYKRASTEEIARRANISKGLLFHYFRNKETFHLYLYDYVEQTIFNSEEFKKLEEFTDFFEALEYTVRIKYELVTKSPEMFDFIMNFFWWLQEQQWEEWIQLMERRTQDWVNVFQNVDFSKFKSEVDPADVMEMLYYYSMGAMVVFRGQSRKIGMEEMMRMAKKWMDFMRKASYQEEYLKE